MALDLFSSTIGEAFKYLSGFLYSKISTIFKYQTNINSLKNERSHLTNRKKSIEEELEQADKEGKVPTPEVKTWLKGVEKIEQDLDSMESDITANEARLHGCCINCRLRYRLSRDAQRKAEEVKQLVRSGVFPSAVAVVNPRVQVVEQIPGLPVAAQKTAFEMMDEILKLLADDDIRKIGIWGMGGVGKTTLVRTLNNKLRDSSFPKRFDIVIWITVSKDTDVKTIQSRLAERLNMSISRTESTERSAIRLFERLQKEKKILLILDDVWEKIDLDKVGIPHGDAHPGCKTILTTRFMEVCREMETEREIKVNVLSEEDAWVLFSSCAGDVVKLEEVRSLAKGVSKECGGLPLALVTVGKAMRRKKRPELWKNVLSELRRSAPYIRGIEKEVFLPLKWSYDSLQGKNIKPCFLYCSMYPEDYSIEVSELVHCWMAEGLIDESDDLEETSNRGFAIVENLIDSCMLEPGAREGMVKMHDVVRDVAIWIASSSEPEFETFAQSGRGLTKFPEELVNESFRRVSLMNNKIEKLPDRLITSSKLLSLSLQRNPLKDIPQEFFVGLSALRVLNLSDTYLKTLPHSLRSLGDLRALFLRRCYSLTKLPHLGEFKKLIVLDLHSTQIQELPDGMAELCNLRQLNLSGTRNLVNIQTGVIAQLSSLERLEMDFSACIWDVSGSGLHSMGRATFDELSSLMHLRFLYINIVSVAFLSLDLSWLMKLKKFVISVGPRKVEDDFFQSKFSERVVVLRSIDLSGKARFEKLLANASQLLLVKCRGISSICEFVESGTRAFVGLKSLIVINCNDMTCVIKGELFQESILPDLEELNLFHLPNLKYILEGMIPNGEILRKLRTIHMLDCPALSCLFTIALLPHVQSLEEIRVDSCSTIIILLPREVNVADFSKVRVLDLRNLSSLHDVSNNPLAWPSLERLTVHNCPYLNKNICIDNQNLIRDMQGDAQRSVIRPGGRTILPHALRAGFQFQRDCI